MTDGLTAQTERPTYVAISMTPRSHAPEWGTDPIPDYAPIKGHCLPQREWRGLVSLAARIVNHTDETSESEIYRRLVQNMHRRLDRLERRYGRLPELLQVRADYVCDLNQRIALLLEAWESASSSADTFNLAAIAESLAETYIVRLRDAQEGRKWVTRLKHVLKSDWSAETYCELRTLQADLTALKKE